MSVMHKKNWRHHCHAKYVVTLPGTVGDYGHENLGRQHSPNKTGDYHFTVVLVFNREVKDGYLERPRYEFRFMIVDSMLALSVSFQVRGAIIG